MNSQSIIKDFTDLISQKYCFYCGKIEEVICAECIMFQINNPKMHFINNIPVLSLMKNDHIITSLIVAYKDQGVSTLKEPFARILSFGLKHFSKHKNMKVVNVPSSAKAIQKRGLDPISLMTETACLLAGKRFIYEKRLLINCRERQDQAGLNFQQRKLNTESAFKANFAEIKPVIIVDDLLTTGSSITQSIFALRAKKIKIKACVILASNH